MSFINLKTFYLGESDCLFASCYFNFSNKIIGDKDAVVVAGALKLSLDTLLNKVSKIDVIHCNKNQIAGKFSSLAEDNLTYNVLPTCIESFDSDMGLFFYMNNCEFLVIKKWDEDKLIFTPIKKEAYFREIESCSKILFDAWQNKYEVNIDSDNQKYI